MVKKKKKLEIPEIVYETVYTLRHIETGRLLRMERTSNAGGDFCGEYTVNLYHYGGDEPFDMDTWYIDEAFNAEYVRQFSTEWYNSSERTPQHSYKPEELEVVEIKREIRTCVKPTKVPTFEDYMKLKYEKTEPEHCKYILEEYAKSPISFGTSPYSLWDLMMLVEGGKWNPEGDEDGSDN